MRSMTGFGYVEGAGELGYKFSENLNHCFLNLVAVFPRWACGKINNKSGKGAYFLGESKQEEFEPWELFGRG